jgi:hypothetical protein
MGRTPHWSNISLVGGWAPGRPRRCPLPSSFHVLLRKVGPPTVNSRADAAGTSTCATV